MNPTPELTPSAADKLNSVDVFEAARRLNELWNSSAHAVSADHIEWQCDTWGSGRGNGSWEETAIFAVVAERFQLETFRNREERDELVVMVPLERFADVAELIGRLGEEAEAWPWLVWDDDVDEHIDDDEALRRQIAVAADILGLSPDALAVDDQLLETLRIID